MECRFPSVKAPDDRLSGRRTLFWSNAYITRRYSLSVNSALRVRRIEFHYSLRRNSLQTDVQQAKRLDTGEFH